MEQLRNALEELGLPHDKDRVDRFEAYMKGLLEWNTKVNVTAIEDRDEFVQKHFIDSLLCVQCREFKEAKSIVDVGTGGGFPGIPLALAAPEKKFVLMDSLKKKLNIIDDLCNRLGITNVETFHGRAEDMGHMKEHREQYDLCISRAVAPLPVLLEYCIPLVREQGAFLAYKGPGCEKELEESVKTIGLLGGALERVDVPNYSGMELNHRIVVIGKKGLTPSKYPRKAGMPSKKPLK